MWIVGLVLVELILFLFMLLFGIVDHIEPPKQVQPPKPCPLCGVLTREPSECVLCQDREFSRRR